MKQYLFPFGSIIYVFTQTPIDDHVSKIIALLVPLISEILRFWWTQYKRKKQDKNEL